MFLRTRNWAYVMSGECQEASVSRRPKSYVEFFFYCSSSVRMISSSKARLAIPSAEAEFFFLDASLRLSSEITACVP